MTNYFSSFEDQQFFGLGPEPEYAHEGGVYVSLDVSLRQQRSGRILVGPVCKSLSAFRQQIDAMKAELDTVYSAAVDRFA